MFNQWETYYIQLVKGEQHGIIASLLRGILWLFSWIYQAIIFIRNWAYDSGLLRTYSPPVPVVISVGNIVVGGTGKTPITMMLANEFYNNFVIAILSRGYRARIEKLATPEMLSRGHGPIQSVDYCGDEPFLIAQNLPKAYVFVGKDRHKASNMAAKAGAELIILDDGMQHRKLARDYEIVVMDAGDPFGQGYFLPRGFLREGPKALKRADLIVLNHSKNFEEFMEIKKKIECYTSAPIIGTRFQVAEIKDLEGNAIPGIEGMRVGVFCGIAHPEYFLETIKSLKCDVVSHKFFPDHLGFNKNGLQKFSEACAKQGAQYIVCTEKDRVKLTPSLESPIPIVWVQMKLQIVEGEADWISFIDKIKENLTDRR